MATNMEKVTRAISKFGLMPVEALSGVSEVSYSQLYKLAKQGNATFEIKNGTAFPKVAELVEKEVNKECKKWHMPDYLFWEGKPIYEHEKQVPLKALESIAEVGTDDMSDSILASVCLAAMQEMKRRKEGEK